LQQIASPDGVFTMCAMDHRGSLRKMINEQEPKTVSYQEMVARKLELCESLAEDASAVLLDPVFGAAQCVSRGVLPRSTGLLVSIEASGYAGGEEKRLAVLLEGWGVAKIKQMGAQAVKLLVYYRPDLTELATKQLETISTVAQDCTQHDIPLLVESVTYPANDEAKDPAAFAARKGQMVIQAAREITVQPVDVLKTEFPADLRYEKDKARLSELCRNLDSASRIPWVILSRGVDFELFSEQVAIACQAGASGFLAGRAIWKEAMSIDDARERRRFLTTSASDRLKQLNEIAVRYAVPWYKKLKLDSSELAAVPEGWYQGY
jgi:tagatose 1,6-diphosphate aldolase